MACSEALRGLYFDPRLQFYGALLQLVWVKGTRKWGVTEAGAFPLPSPLVIVLDVNAF